MISRTFPSNGPTLGVGSTWNYISDVAYGLDFAAEVGSSRRTWNPSLCLCGHPLQILRAEARLPSQFEVASVCWGNWDLVAWSATALDWRRGIRVLGWGWFTLTFGLVDAALMRSANRGFEFCWSRHRRALIQPRRHEPP